MNYKWQMGALVCKVIAKLSGKLQEGNTHSALLLLMKEYRK